VYDDNSLGFRQVLKDMVHIDRESIEVAYWHQINPLFTGERELLRGRLVA
jgi:hypothetical protein